MKAACNILLLISSCLASHVTRAQEWVAVIDFEISHSHYGYQSIDHANLSFSGIVASGSSENNRLSLTIAGNYPISGDINVSLYGMAWGPYNANDAESISISGTYTGNYQTPCVRKGFRTNTPFSNVTINVWIEIFPRMEISYFLQDCDKLTLASNSCATSYLWEVSENISNGFRTIPGKLSSSITVTRQELAALGFTSPYGRKYFRVTGNHNPTSFLQPVDIYYAGPGLTGIPRNPSCADGTDGLVEVQITSPLPSVIDDFVVTLLNSDSGDPLDQEYLVDRNTISFLNLAEGNYMVRVENNTSIATYGNCWIERSFAVVDPAPVVISSAQTSNYNGYHVSCFGAADGSIQVQPSGGTETFVSFEWSPEISTSSIAIDLVGGSYQVRIKDSNGCWSDQYNYVMTQPPKLSGGLVSTGGKNGFDVSCHGSADGAIHADITGGVLPYTYVWNDGGTASLRRNLTAEFYAVSATDANGCQIASEIQLIAPEPMSFNIEEIHNITCAGDRTGILEVQSIANAIGNMFAQWSTGETGMEVVNKPAGVYTVRITDDQGCSAEKSYELQEPPGVNAEVFATSDYNGAPISCHGADDGMATAHLYDVYGNAVIGERYTWYRNGVAFLSGPAASAANVGAGTYTVAATYNTFCQAEAVLTLEEPQPVTVLISNVSNFSGSLISCAGVSDAHIRADASGGTAEDYTFAWNTGTTGADLQGVGTGTYRVTVRDVNGCTAIAQKHIIEPEVLDTQIQQLIPVTCHGTSDARLKATATGGIWPYDFVWNAGTSGEQLNDLGPGAYHVTTTDANGCTSVDSLTITEPKPLAATIMERSDFHGTGVSCEGASDGYLRAYAAGGTEPYMFHWRGSQNYQPLHADLEAGTYRVLVSDRNGCRDSADAVVSEPPAISIRVTGIRNISCHEGSDGEISVLGSGGSGMFEYSSGESWQPNPLIHSLGAGWHTVRVRDANGCTDMTTQLLTEPVPLAIRFYDKKSSLCGDPVGQVTSVISGGMEPYTLDWTDTHGRTVGHDHTIASLPPGIFTLDVSDSNGCVARESVGIPSTDGPIVGLLRSSPASCSYSSDGIAVLEAYGEGPFEFTWPNGETLPEAHDLAKGTYLVKTIDANLCLTVTPVVIDAPEPIALEVVEYVMPTCHGDCDGSMSVVAHGGNGNYTFSWHDIPGPALDNICAGTYTVTVVDDKQCVAIESIEMEQPALITSQPGRVWPPTCAHDCDAAIAIDASGGTGELRYAWSNGSQGSLAEDLCAGEHSLIISDEKGCVADLRFAIEDPETPSLELGSPVVMCKGQTRVVDPGAGWDSYRWASSRGHTSSERWLTITEPGAYWLFATDWRGCVTTDTLTIETSDDVLKANFLLTTSAQVRDTVVAIDVSWPMPQTARWILPEQMEQLTHTGDVVHGMFETPGTYTLSLEATLGECRDQMTKSLVIGGKEPESDESGRIGHRPFLEGFTIYPNPTNGDFDLAVSLIEESQVIITIFDAMSSRMIAQFSEDGKSNYTIKINLSPLTAGMYTVRLDHREGTAFKRIVVK